MLHFSVWDSHTAMPQSQHFLLAARVQGTPASSARLRIPTISLALTLSGYRRTHPRRWKKNTPSRDVWACSVAVKSVTEREIVMKPLSIIEWYQVCVQHYHWTMFETIRYVLWLAR